MKEKNNKIHLPESGYIRKLPYEMLKEVKYRLPEQTQNDQTQFVLVNKLFYKSSQTARLLLKLFQCIEERNKEKVAILLKIRPDLVAVKGVYTDGIGRDFSEISPFQFAFWCLDIRTMCHAMLDSLPQNQYGYELRKKLLEQAESAWNKGLPYVFNGRNYLGEPHFNLSPLLNSLQGYLNINECHVQKLAEYWCTVVGKEQISLPVRVRQFICSYKECGRSLAVWDSLPDSEEEDEEEQPRQLQWNNKLEGLGFVFAITCSLEAETYLEPVALNRVPQKWVKTAFEQLSNLYRVILENELPYLFECLTATNRINGSFTAYK